MADYTQTPANVKLKTGSHGSALAGETITQGEPIYLTNSTVYRCQADGTAEEAACTGIALTAAASGQIVIYALPGSTLDIGATLTVTDICIVSVNAGKIAPSTDLASSSYLTILGGATTTSTLLFNPIVLGVEKA